MSYQPLWILKNTLENILEYISRFWQLANVFWTNADIRATLVWWTTAVTGVLSWVNNVTTVATVTTCWTVTNQTNIGWYSAQSQIPALMNMETTLGNIDNIYIS